MRLAKAKSALYRRSNHIIVMEVSRDLIRYQTKKANSISQVGFVYFIKGNLLLLANRSREEGSIEVCDIIH